MTSEPCTNKKAFTVTELAIVIAVIAVLAAVIIPTFIGIIEKANISADIQTARQMQMIITLTLADESADAENVVSALLKNGFSENDLYASSKNGVFAWMMEERTIVLYTEGEEILYPEYLQENYSLDEIISASVPLYNVLGDTTDAPSESESLDTESASEETSEPSTETTEEEVISSSESSVEEPEASTKEETSAIPTESSVDEEPTTASEESSSEETTVPPAETAEETTTVAPETTELTDDNVILIRPDDEFQQAIENASEEAILKLDCDIHSVGFNVTKSIIIDLNQNTLYLDLTGISISVYGGVVLEIRNGAIVATGFSEEIYAAVYLLKNAEVQFVSVRMTAEYLNVFDMSDDSSLVLENSDIYADGIVVNSIGSDTFVNISDAELHSENTAIYLNNVKKFFAEICDIYAPLAIDAGGGSVELRNTNAYLEDGSGGVMCFGGGTELSVEMQSVSVAQTELIAPTEGKLNLYYDNVTVTEFFFDKEKTPVGTIFLNYLDVLDPEN